MSARPKARVSVGKTRSRRLTHGPEEGAARIAAAAKAVRDYLSAQRYGTHRRQRRVLGVIEAVRQHTDPEWYYIVIVQCYEGECEILLAWAEHGRWRVRGRATALSWAGAVVEAMAEATRLEG